MKNRGNCRHSTYRFQIFYIYRHESHPHGQLSTVDGTRKIPVINRPIQLRQLSQTAWCVSLKFPLRRIVDELIFRYLWQPVILISNTNYKSALCVSPSLDLCWSRVESCIACTHEVCTLARAHISHTQYTECNDFCFKSGPWTLRMHEINGSLTRAGEEI